MMPQAHDDTLLCSESPGLVASFRRCLGVVSSSAIMESSRRNAIVESILPRKKKCNRGGCAEAKNHSPVQRDVSKTNVGQTILFLSISTYTRRTDGSKCTRSSTKTAPYQYMALFVQKSTLYVPKTGGETSPERTQDCIPPPPLP